MADFGNFQVETPQEVLQRIDAQFQQDVRSNDPRIRQQALFDRALKGVFGNPEAERAQKKMDALNEVTTSVRDKFKARREAGEDISQLDEELEALRQQRDVLLRQGDTEAALQATQSLTDLGIEKKEQQRLKERADIVNEQVAANAEALRISNQRKLAEGAFLYHRKKDGSYEALNLDEEPDRLRHAELLNDGSTPLTQSQVFQLQRDEALAAQRAALSKTGAIGGKPQLRKLRDQSNAARDLIFTGNRLLEIFEEDPNALSGASKVAGKVDQLLQTARTTGNILAGQNSGTDGVNNFSFNKRLAEEFFEKNRVNARAQGLITGLAYTLARSKDPGGRLSDDDFRRALDMLGGGNQINPAAIVDALRDNLDLSTAATMMSLEASKGDYPEGTFDAVMNQIANETAKFDELSQRVVSKIQEQQVDNVRVGDGPGPLDRFMQRTRNNPVTNAALLAEFGTQPENVGNVQQLPDTRIDTLRELVDATPAQPIIRP